MPKGARKGNAQFGRHLGDKSTHAGKFFRRSMRESLPRQNLNTTSTTSAVINRSNGSKGTVKIVKLLKIVQYQGADEPVNTQ
jgi:hypothetical protein